MSPASNLVMEAVCRKQKFIVAGCKLIQQACVRMDGTGLNEDLLCRKRARWHFAAYGRNFHALVLARSAKLGSTLSDFEESNPIKLRN